MALLSAETNPGGYKMIKEECGSCAHFAQEQEQCRRYPPTVHMDIYERVSHARTLWPTVKQEDWCGEYRQADFARPHGMKGTDEGS